MSQHFGWYGCNSAQSVSSKVVWNFNSDNTITSRLYATVVIGSECPVTFAGIRIMICHLSLSIYLFCIFQIKAHAPSFRESACPTHVTIRMSHGLVLTNVEKTLLSKFLHLGGIRPHVFAPYVFCQLMWWTMVNYVWTFCLAINWLHNHMGFTALNWQMTCDTNAMVTFIHFFDFCQIRRRFTVVSVLHMFHLFVRYLYFYDLEWSLCTICSKHLSIAENSPFLIFKKRQSWHLRNRTRGNQRISRCLH